MKIRVLTCIFCCTVSLLFSANPSEEKQSTSDEFYDHKQQFHDLGYIWIKEFFSKEQVQILRRFAEEAHQSGLELLDLAKASGISHLQLCQSIPGSLIVVPEASDPNQLCRTEDMLSVFPDLYYLIEGTVTSYISAVLENRWTLFKDKLNFKWPGGGAFASHQDHPAFETFGPTEFITAMVCIDPATEENGCLKIAKNWKKDFRGNPLVDQEKLEQGCAVLPYVVGGPNHGSIEKAFIDQIEWLSLQTSPGDLVIFSSFLPHYSNKNQSLSPRRAMFFTLNRLSEGNFRKTYYHTKRSDPENPLFHFATPTQARGK